MAKKEDKTSISVAKITVLGGIVVAFVGGIFTLLAVALRSAPTPTPTVDSITLIPSVRQELQAIEFNYTDDPTNHEWQLSETTTVTYSHLSSGLYGNVLKIESPDVYALDIDVSPAAQFGKWLEYAVKPDDDSAPIYAKIRIRSGNGALSQEAWLKFTPDGPGQPIEETQDREWVVFPEPKIRPDGWLEFQIDLQGEFKRTYGLKGWTLERLDGIRVRSNQAIAYIHIFQ